MAPGRPAPGPRLGHQRLLIVLWRVAEWSRSASRSVQNRGGHCRAAPVRRAWRPPGRAGRGRWWDRVGGDEVLVVTASRNDAHQLAVDLGADGHGIQPGWCRRRRNGGRRLSSPPRRAPGRSVGALSPRLPRAAARASPSTGGPAAGIAGHRHRRAGGPRRLREPMKRRIRRGLGAATVTMVDRCGQSSPGVSPYRAACARSSPAFIPQSGLPGHDRKRMEAAGDRTDTLAYKWAKRTVFGRHPPPVRARRGAGRRGSRLREEACSAGGRGQARTPPRPSPKPGGKSAGATFMASPMWYWAYSSRPRRLTSSSWVSGSRCSSSSLIAFRTGRGSHNP
jgi:hypothetical protein